MPTSPDTDWADTADAASLLDAFVTLPTVPQGPLHEERARGDDFEMGSGPPPHRRHPVPGHPRRDRRLHRHDHAHQRLAAQRNRCYGEALTRLDIDQESRP